MLLDAIFKHIISKMKILQIIHGYPPHYNAGSEVYTQSICEELSKTHEVHVFSREENPYEPDFRIRRISDRENLTFYLANMAQGKDGYRHPALDDAFRELVNEISPDVAHVGHLNHLSTGFVDVLDALNIPIVFTLHDFWLMCPRGQFIQRHFNPGEHWPLCHKQEHRVCATKCYSSYFSNEQDADDSQFWTQWIKKRMLETNTLCKKVDQFIAPSSYLMKRFVDEFGIPEEKILYLDYGFPLHYLTPNVAKQERAEFTFGYIGTHIPAKGINQLIEAFKKLKGNVRLKIWGSKDQQSTKVLRTLAQDSLNPVNFMGEYVNRNLADEVFSQVDCIVVPSIWAENSPLVIHEAQACHIPVITANYGGMAEYVQHEVNGLLYEHRSIQDLVSKMQWATDHPSEMFRLGKRGYLYHKNGFVPSIAEHVQKLESIYHNVLKKRATQSLWRITLDTNPEDCNLKCVMCEEHSEFSNYIHLLQQETGVRKRRMPVEWIENILDQASALSVREIIPSTMGEPLIYNAIDRIYALAKERGIKVNLTTNGTFPRRSVEEWAQLILPNTSDVKISWNGATKETSEKIMKGVRFEKVLSNLKKFIQLRDEHFASTGEYCKVTLQLTFMQNNMQELAEIIRLAAEHNVDRVKGHHLWAHFDEIKGLSMKQNTESVKKWNAYVEDAHQMADQILRSNGQKVILENVQSLHYTEQKEIPADYECPFLGKEIWISATGKISPCCAPDKQRDSLGDFGNIQHQNIADVLISENYRRLVREYKSHPLCKTCNMRKPTLK
jgi:glycosyltransferase involved in cell wall biosynthesis/MoaA/NifB/PqqE/SkfB family radical SAM enzyme